MYVALLYAGAFAIKEARGGIFRSDGVEVVGAGMRRGSGGGGGWSDDGRTIAEI